MRRPAETNGHGPDDADEGHDLLAELVDRIRGIDDRLGHSPDHATGSPGSGLCRTVAELKAESDYQARRRLERDQKSERWKSRAQAGYAVVGALGVVLGALWAGLKLLVMLSK